MMNIESLAEEANKILKNSMPEKSDDKRQSNTISVRRIRDYISKGLLEKPIKQGKAAFFNEAHLNTLISLRELQNDGLSEANIRKLSSSSEVSASLQTSALDTINEIKYGSSFNPVGSLGLKASSNSLVNSYYDVNNKSQSIFNIQLPKTKEWKEYPLDNTGNIYLKIENGFLIKDKKEILNLIDSILTIGEKK